MVFHVLPALVGLPSALCLPDAPLLILRNSVQARAGVARLAGVLSGNRKVVGSGPGVCDPRFRCIRKATNQRHMDVSLFRPLSKKAMKNILR